MIFFLNNKLLLLLERYHSVLFCYTNPKYNYNPQPIFSYNLNLTPKPKY